MKYSQDKLCLYYFKQQKMNLQIDDLTYYTQITLRYSYNRYLRLGGGSFANVYKGYDNQQKRYIAVKQIAKSVAFAFRGDELKQVAILRKLKHPNIMQFYGKEGTNSSPEGIFLFLELCQKGTLKELISKSMTELRVYQIFKQLVDAMAYINKAEFFHRDLKPENLLITSNNELKIADFGLARQIELGKSTTFNQCTFQYSAPEVFVEDFYKANQEYYNQKCDVFSAGYILYEMLTSERLNKDLKTVNHLKNFFMKNRAIGYNIDHVAVTPKWRNILLKMLSFDIKNRPSFHQISQIIKDFQPPIDKLPIYQSPSIDQQQQSSKDLKKIKDLVDLIYTKNNYFVNILKVFYKYQMERSQVVPRIYKILLLYFSLCYYCLLSQQFLKKIDNKRQFILYDEKRSIAELQECLTIPDKSFLCSYLKELSTKINKGKQQMNMYLTSNIIADLQSICQSPQHSPQKIVIEEFRITNSLKLFKHSGEYEMGNFYKLNISKCVNNMYRTAAELETLTTHDLKIYLVVLYVDKIQFYVNMLDCNGTKLPPMFEEIIAMDRDTLYSRISEEKNRKL